MSKKVEIDEVDLVRYRDLAQNVQHVMKHPQARLLVQQAHKIVNPDAITPELDTHHQVMAPVKALEKKFDDFISGVGKQAEDNQRAATLANLKAQEERGIAELRRQGWNDEGITAVQKMMSEKGILDPLDAAAIFEKHHPPQQVATPSGTGAWNFAEGLADDQVDLKKLLDTKGQNDVVADNMAQTALNEFRTQMVRR